MITINGTYKFNFTTKFASLDGVYTCVEITSFEAALSAGVDFVKYLYTPAGLAQADYEADYTNYQGKTVYELQSVGTTATVSYFVPGPVLSAVPDPTVQMYQNIYLKVLIGPFQDTTVYSWIQNQIQDMVTSVTGSTGTVEFFANPDNNVWLTESEYLALQAQRQANIKTVAPLSTINQNNLTLINTLKGHIAALEAIIVASQS